MSTTSAIAETCIVCGEGPNELGCLVALAWSTELAGYKWAHVQCAESEGLRQRLIKPRHR